MSRTAAKVTQADLARALRAAEQVGAGRLIVEVTREGVIRIMLKCEGLDTSPSTSVEEVLHNSMADWK
jgi:hypothetical protein